MTGNKVTWFFVLGTIFLCDYVWGDNQQSSGDSFDLERYHSYGEILRFISNLAVEDSNKFKLHRIGKTYEGRDLVLVRASKDFRGNRPIILVDGGAHAREWAAIATTLTLLAELKNDESGLLHYADWYVIPVVNPDGYEYTRVYDRMWRKNRSVKKGSSCVGVDVNRNYNFHWSESGTSTDPCDREIYPGPQGFSEAESKAVASVMGKFRQRIKLYMSIHAFGNYMVYPYGFTGNDLPKSWRRMDHFARNVTGEISKVNGETFKVMSAGQWYPGAGGSDDYAFGALDIPYSYTVELTDGYKFEYPEELLPKLVKEAQVLFKSAGKLICKEFC